LECTVSSGSYAETRAEVSETMQVYAAFDEARHQLLEHFGRREHEIGSVESAVAARLVALLTQGVEVPSNPGLPKVLAPNGRRIAVTNQRVERAGLFSCFLASPRIGDWDEIALVIFLRGRPQVIHIIDRERIPFVEQMLGVGLGGSLGGRKPEGVALNVLFHSNVMLDPLLAEASGVRTFVLDVSPDVGWTRVASD